MILSLKELAESQSFETVEIVDEIQNFFENYEP